MSSFFLQLPIVLGAIILGMRMRGIGLGLTSSLALLVLFFCFGVKPDSTSFGSVTLIMIAALIVAAALEAAGSLALLTFWAKQIFIKYPRYLLWSSALLSYWFSFFIGTSHIIYALLPIIATAAQKGGIRPEKPLVASVLASQQAILASPLSAATAIMLNHLTGKGYTQGHLLAIFLPGTLFGTLMTTWFIGRLHKDLNFCVLTDNQGFSRDFKEQPFARKALCLFLGGLLMRGLCRSICSLLGKKGPDIPEAHLTALALLSVAGIIACFTGTQKIGQSKIFTMGMQTVIAILGVVWLSRSFLRHHQATLENYARHIEAAWGWGLFLFLLTIVSTSQSTSLELVLPLALSVIAPSAIFAIIPAANSFYVLPSYPTILAAIALDKTGSTRVGRFVLNHSFLLPGLFGTFASCLGVYAMSSFLG